MREALYTVKEEIFFSEKKRRMLEDRRRVKSALRAKRDARKAAAPVEGERYCICTVIYVYMFFTKLASKGGVTSQMSKNKFAIRPCHHPPPQRNDVPVFPIEPLVLDLF